DGRFNLAGKRREQGALGLVCRTAVRRELRPREIAFRSYILAMVERAIYPFEVEQLDKGLSYALVGEDRPARVEHERRHAGRRLNGQFLLEDTSIADGGEVITLSPARRIPFAAQAN